MAHHHLPVRQGGRAMEQIPRRKLSLCRPAPAARGQRRGLGATATFSPSSPPPPIPGVIFAPLIPGDARARRREEGALAAQLPVRCRRWAARTARCAPGCAALGKRQRAAGCVRPRPPPRASRAGAASPLGRGWLDPPPPCSPCGARQSREGRRRAGERRAPRAARGCERGEVRWASCGNRCPERRAGRAPGASLTRSSSVTKAGACRWPSSLRVPHCSAWFVASWVKWNGFSKVPLASCNEKRFSSSSSALCSRLSALEIWIPSGGSNFLLSLPVLLSGIRGFGLQLLCQQVSRAAAARGRGLLQGTEGSGSEEHQLCSQSRSTLVVFLFYGFIRIPRVGCKLGYLC